MEEKYNGNKVFAILSYIGILWIIGLLADKESEFTKFHVNQGIWLFIISVVGAIIPCLGWIVDVVMFVFMIMGIIYAAKGETKTLPLFYKLPKIVK